MTTASTESTTYVDVRYSTSWGDAPVTDKEHRAACERMESWLDEHAPDHMTFYVRPNRAGECEGVYECRASGDLQILGYSIPAPDDVTELLNRAWEHACESWPTVVSEAV